MNWGQLEREIDSVSFKGRDVSVTLILTESKGVGKRGIYNGLYIKFHSNLFGLLLIILVN